MQLGSLRLNSPSFSLAKRFRALQSAPLGFATRPHKLSEESLIKDF